MIPEESPWMALAIFGTLAWMPLRNIFLIVRRKLHRLSQRRKQQHNGILKRGGKFSGDDTGNSIMKSYQRQGIMNTFFQYVRGEKETVAESSSSGVQFEEHSDGSVYRQRRFYHPSQNAAETSIARDILTTPSPVRQRQQQWVPRVATPMPKKKPSVAERMEAAATSPENNNQFEKENKKPRQDTPYRQKQQDTTPYRKKRQDTPFKQKVVTATSEPEIYYRSPSVTPKEKSTSIVLQSPGPYLPPVLDHTLAVLKDTKPSPVNRKKLSFLQMPRDPNYLLPYATSKRRTTTATSSQEEQQQQQSKSTSNPRSALKRKFGDDPNTAAAARPHKKDRLTLKRAKRLYSKARASVAPVNTPTKRKARHEELIQEFSRKRPKMTPKKSAAAAANPFGGGASTGGNPFDGNKDDKPKTEVPTDGKPAFSFGGGVASASKSADDAKPTADSNKPAFSFGGTKPAADAKSTVDAAATKPTDSSGAKPAFSFGGVSDPATPAKATDAAGAAPKPAFAFGASAAPAPEDPAAAAAAPKPAFSFGGGGASATAPAVAAPSTGGAPAFSFGGKPPAAPIAAPPAGGAPEFSFGGAAPAAAPPAAPGGAPAFSFGGAAPPAAPPVAAGGAFSFGGAAPAVPPAAPGFGAAPAFGGAPPTAPPGAFGGPPTGGTGFVPARNANRVKKRATGGRSRRRGAA